MDQIESMAAGTYWRRGDRLLEFESMSMEKGKRMRYCFLDSLSLKPVELSEQELEQLTLVVPLAHA